MAGLAVRFLGDLKKDRKKTALLIALAAVFFYVWIPIMKSSDAAAPAAPGAKPTASASRAAQRNSRAASNNVKNSAQAAMATVDGEYLYPTFLTEPLKASVLAHNPFLPLASERKVKEASPVQKAEPKKDDAEVIREKEQQRLKEIKVASILTFGTSSSCTVSDQILYMGSVYKGFTVKAIESNYVVFVGQAGEYRITIENPR